MSKLPTFAIICTAVCDVDGDYEGRIFQIKWLGWAFEITLVRLETPNAR